MYEFWSHDRGISVHIRVLAESELPHCPFQGLNGLTTTYTEIGYTSCARYVHRGTQAVYLT